MDATQAPRWFEQALAQRPEHRDVEVQGCRVHLRAWGPEGRPGVVLVHGGAAHSGWWDHVAPFLADGRRVVALDLSGHGDSGRRPDGYDMTSWAAEVVASAGAGGIAGPPVVVGHSMGGWVAVTAGVDAGDRLAGVVVLDSPLNDQPPEEQQAQARRRPLAGRSYATREEAVGRFRTLPEQDVLLPYVKQHVAEQSLREGPDGWTWKFDPGLFGRGRRLMREMLPALRCRAGFFRCEHGLVGPEMAATIRGLLPPGVPVVELPDAGHHPMLDQPLPLVAALRTLLTTWEHAVRD